MENTGIKIIGETAIICSFAMIVGKFKELLDIKNNGSRKFSSFLKSEMI
jgi:hypothetical protein